jgi:hypothetical protein
LLTHGIAKNIALAGQDGVCQRDEHTGSAESSGVKAPHNRSEQLAIGRLLIVQTCEPTAVEADRDLGGAGQQFHGRENIANDLVDRDPMLVEARVSMARQSRLVMIVDQCEELLHVMCAWYHSLASPAALMSSRRWHPR